jgi:hypothetical protein
MAPSNNFNGFFSGKNPPAMTYTPTPTQVAEALMQLAGASPFFYKDEAQRLIVVKGIHYLTNWMLDEVEAGRRPDFHVGYAAFMMMLAQVIEMTHEEFAGKEERENFPLFKDDDEDEEEDLDL